MTWGPMKNLLEWQRKDSAMKTQVSEERRAEIYGVLLRRYFVYKGIELKKLVQPETCQAVPANRGKLV